MIEQPGDCILYPVRGDSENSSKIVAAMEILQGYGHGLEQYSHVAIYIDPGIQFEFKWPRSGFFPIDSKRTYELWNVGNPTDNQRDRIIHWCMENQGEWYNMTGLLTAGIFGLPHTAVCSQGFDRAYTAAGIYVPHEGHRLLSPNAIPDWDQSKMICRMEPRK